MTTSFRNGQRAFFGVALLVMAAAQTQGCAAAPKSSSPGSSGGATSRSFGGAGGTLASWTSSGGRASGGSHAGGGAGGGSRDAATVTSPGDASPADEAREADFISWTYNGKEVGLYLPTSTGKPLPVAMYLHSCNNVSIHTGYWLVSALNAIEPCAVLLPTAPPSIDYTCADWGGTYDQDLRPNLIDALAVLDQVLEQYGFDSKRQYLYGESMGGEGVFRLLADFPTRFAGAVSASGYTLDTGAAEMAETPLWIFHGSEDGISPVENDRAIYQSILDAGGTLVKYTEYPGLDHVPAIEQARTEPGLLDWLLAQHRP
jgi:poly(3-hydroxybutyrate) depolymerase